MRLSTTAANSSVRGTSSLREKSPAAMRSAPSLISRIWPLIRLEAYSPIKAAMSATTTALIPMRT